MDTKQEITGRGVSNNNVAMLFPPVDVIEDENGITLTADLPGVTKENLGIRVDADMLTIEGAITLSETQSMTSVYAEIHAAQYKRTFTLSRELDMAQIAASIKDGVLNIKFPKCYVLEFQGEFLMFITGSKGVGVGVVRRTLP